MFSLLSSVLLEWSRGHIIAVLAAVALVYIVCVRFLRHRRHDRIKRKFAHRELSTMTVDEAYDIVTELQTLEFPMTFGLARQIALLKVWTTCLSDISALT